MQQHLHPEIEPSLPLPMQAQAIKEAGREVQTQTVSDTSLSAPVSKLLTDVQRKIKRRRLQFWTSFALMEGAALSTKFLRDHNRFGIAPSTGLRAACLVAVVGFVLTLVTFLRPVGYDVDALVQAEGANAAGTLLDALRSGLSARERRVIYTALGQVLLQMKASDAHLLTAKHRTALYWTLRLNRIVLPWWRWFDDYKIAALRALGQIGDRAAIPIVERYANTRGGGKRGARIREAAQETLPLLRIHAGEVTPTRTLLRPASQEEAAPGTLLRAATSGEQTPAEQLVRPIE